MNPIDNPLIRPLLEGLHWGVGQGPNSYHRHKDTGRLREQRCVHVPGHCWDAQERVRAAVSSFVSQVFWWLTYAEIWYDFEIVWNMRKRYEIYTCTNNHEDKMSYGETGAWLDATCGEAWTLLRIFPQELLKKIPQKLKAGVQSYQYQVF